MRELTLGGRAARVWQASLKEDVRGVLCKDDEAHVEKGAAERTGRIAIWCGGGKEEVRRRGGRR